MYINKDFCPFCPYLVIATVYEANFCPNSGQDWTNGTRTRKCLQTQEKDKLDKRDKEKDKIRVHESR